MRVDGTWFTSNNMMKAIGELGETVYEREVLRIIFISYFTKFFTAENKRETHTLCWIKYEVEKSGMSRGSYHKALADLQARGIIRYKGRQGSKGGHDVSIITEPIVKLIKHKFKASDILNDTTPIEL